MESTLFLYFCSFAIECSQFYILDRKVSAVNRASMRSGFNKGWAHFQYSQYTKSWFHEYTAGPPSTSVMQHDIFRDVQLLSG
jgi:hypothetical protein